MLNKFFLLFTQRTHITYMQTSMLNVLVCRKSPMKNFQEYYSFGRRNIWRPDEFSPTTWKYWIQQKSPSRFESEMTRLVQNPIRNILFLPNHDMLKNEASAVKLREYANHYQSRIVKLYSGC